MSGKTKDEIQEEKFNESKCGLKQGSIVIHKLQRDKWMIVIDFKVKWENKPLLVSNGVKNPDLPICRYFDEDKGTWEIKEFNCFELEPID